MTFTAREITRIVRRVLCTENYDFASDYDLAIGDILVVNSKPEDVDAVDKSKIMTAALIAQFVAHNHLPSTFTVDV